MKVSVSLPDDDVEFLDAYAETNGIASRSAVLHKAVRLLRASELGDAYEDSFGFYGFLFRMMTCLWLMTSHVPQSLRRQAGWWLSVRCTLP